MLIAAPPAGDTIAGADTLSVVPPVDPTGVGAGVTGSSPHADTNAELARAAAAIKDLNFTAYMRG